jgi:hypothetical protein
MFVLMTLLQRLLSPMQWVLAPVLRIVHQATTLVTNGAAVTQQVTFDRSPHPSLVLAPIPIRSR